MKRELLALLPGVSDLPCVDGLETVAARDFTAVFAPAAPPWVLGPALRRHRLGTAAQRQHWLEQLMPAGPVLPFAPGSVLDESEADALIAANDGILRGLVRRLGGRVQYQITVHWAESRVLDQFRAAPEIAPLFDIDTVSATAVSRAVTRLAKRLSEGIEARLSEVAHDLTPLPRKSGILTNLVLLVPDAETGALDRALEDIDAIWTDGLRIRQIGPGPAVSFASLRLTRHRPSEVARALTLLGLRASDPPEAVHAARNRLLRGAAPEAAAIRAAARLAEAALRIGGTGRTVCLIETWSEGRSAEPGLEQVA